MAPQECKVALPVHANRSKQLHMGKSASQSRSRSTSASSSPNSLPGSELASSMASPDCQVAVPIESAGSPAFFPFEEVPQFHCSQALDSLNSRKCRPLMLDSLLQEETVRGFCPPPGLEGVVPHEGDCEDDLAWAVASAAAEIALCSPVSEPNKLTRTALVLAEATSSPAPGLLQIPQAPMFPAPPPSKAPVLSMTRNSVEHAPPSQPPSLTMARNSSALAAPAPPRQSAPLAGDFQRLPILPPPTQPPAVSALGTTPGVLQFMPPPSQPPVLAACTSLVPPPIQPPLLDAAMQASTDVPPPPMAPILRLADTVPAPHPGTAVLPSAGSENHNLGTCKPCAFFHTKGCGNGSQCEFCHLCAPGEKKRRMKGRRALGRNDQQGQQA